MLGARSYTGRVAGGAETIPLVANFDPSRGVRAECREGVGVEIRQEGERFGPSRHSPRVATSPLHTATPSAQRGSPTLARFSTKLESLKWKVTLGILFRMDNVSIDKLSDGCQQRSRIILVSPVDVDAGRPAP